MVADLPAAKRGYGFRNVSVASYSSSTSSSDESVEVPDDLNSLQFLLFAGLADNVAREIWQAWLARSSRDDWVVDDAIYYIKQKGRELDTVDSTDDWDAALQSMGICEDLRQRILNPEFNTIRLTQCACYWAIDSVNEAFYYLKSLSKRMEKKRSQHISRVQSPDDTARPQRAIQPGGQRHSDASNQPIPVVTSVNAPLQVAGRTMFYKGGAEARLEQCKAHDGTIRIGALHSQAPTDFHPEKSTYLYLTKHHDVAVLYARYVEERVPPSKAAVLHIAIPSPLVSTPREIFDEDWRELIWNSRNTELHITTLKQLPQRLRHYEEADILVGYICGDSTHKIARMTDKSELSAMNRTSHSRASQFVVQSISIQMEIARQCAGFVWLVPYSTSGSK